MKPEKECFWSGAAPWDTPANPCRPEISLMDTFTNDKPDDQLICCGYVPVVLSKMFGPLIFADLRIRAVMSCEWVVERQNIKTNEWVEVIRIPGQAPGEFTEDEL